MDALPTIYEFISDSGHGWLKCQKTHLKILGLIKNITSCSYIHGSDVYLEEDCDATMFKNVFEKFTGLKINVTECYIDGLCFVRNLPHYQPF